MCNSIVFCLNIDVKQHNIYIYISQLDGRNPASQMGCKNPIAKNWMNYLSTAAGPYGFLRDDGNLMINILFFKGTVIICYIIKPEGTLVLGTCSTPVMIFFLGRLGSPMSGQKISTNGFGLVGWFNGESSRMHQPQATHWSPWKLPAKNASQKRCLTTCGRKGESLSC